MFCASSGHTTQWWTKVTIALIRFLLSHADSEFPLNWLRVGALNENFNSEKNCKNQRKRQSGNLLRVAPPVRN